MLIRLLGKEAEALACGWPSPFADQADWAEAYVSYAWVMSLTLGNGDGTFGGEQETTVAQYVTFLLRALGYTTPNDFAWEHALAKAAELGFSVSHFDPNGPIIRADAVLLSRTALDLNTKSGVLLRKAIESVAQVGSKGTPNGTMTSKGSTSSGGIVIQDEAKVGANWKKDILKANDLDIQPNSGKVQVLVVSTHGTEAYSEADGLLYKDSDRYRTRNEDRCVLQVGEVLVNALNSMGIGAVHITCQEDYPNFVGSYERVRPHLVEALAQYPDVQMIIDVHRDAIEKDGKPLAVTTTIDDYKTAQLMLVSAIDYDNWQGNYGLSLAIHQAVEQRYPGLMRPLLVRDATYNQFLTPGSILIEVGSHGNTLSQAMYSVRLLADALGDYLKTH